MTAESLQDLRGKISDLQKNLKFRLKQVGYRDEKFQGRYGNYLKGEFSWTIDIRDRRTGLMMKLKRRSKGMGKRCLK